MKIGRHLAAILVICLALILLFFLQRGGDARIKDADESYQAGEKAPTIAERKTVFNHALDLYLTLEKTYRPQYGTGKLYYDIGNTYYQLGEYPWSVLYYERAKKLMPRSDLVDRNMKIALDKLSLPKPAVGVFDRVFFFHAFLSLPERLQWVFGLGTAAFAFYSAYIWTQRRWLRSVGVLFTGLLIVILCSVGYTRYISPLQAVVVQSVDLRRDAGKDYAKVGDQPVPSGTNVEVVNVAAQGKWLKVLTPKGEMGYVPEESTRLVGP